MRKLKNFQAKGFVMGFLMCALLFSSVLVMGSTQIRWRSVNVAYGPYRIMINGQLFEARDANGRVIDTINLDGWLFAPFEHIAQALGMPSHWDAATTTLYLGSRDVVREVMLFDQPTMDVGVPSEFGVSGTRYANTIRLRTSQASLGSRVGLSFSNHVVYALDARATNFRATLNSTSANISITYRIYGDGRALHSPILLSRNAEPLHVDINVEGVRQLRIEMEIVNNALSQSITPANWRGIENARILMRE